MPQTQSSASPNGGLLASLEQLIRKGPEHDDYAEARTALRTWLIHEARIEAAGTSIGDAISQINPDPAQGATAAKVLTRCLAVPHLLPAANETNQLERRIVTLFEGALPDIADFIGFKTVKQTFEKFNLISGTHRRVCDILNPLSAKYVGLDSLISARSSVLSAMNHGIIRSYGQPFQLPLVRSIIERLLRQLQRVASLEVTLSNDVVECRRTITDGRALSTENTSFLTEDYLSPLLGSAEAALESFLHHAGSHFTTTIALSAGIQKELQKRYPLHEAGREVRLLIPLRNVGPGLAANVRASLTVDTDMIALNMPSVYAGNVKPGDFSVIFDGIVISSSDRLDLLVEVEWMNWAILNRNLPYLNLRHCHNALISTGLHCNTGILIAPQLPKDPSLSGVKRRCENSLANCFAILWNHST
jgi:hypothetical protein